MTQEKVRRHNETELSKMVEGDLIQFKRGPYSHWAVYIGDGFLVHVTPCGVSSSSNGVSSSSNGVSSSSNCCNGREKAKVVVKKDDFWKVAKNSKAFRNNKLDTKVSPLPRNQIVQRALLNLGKFGYDILFNNCEHFASWCRYGEWKSEQADNAKIGIVSGIAGVNILTVIGCFALALIGIIRK